jgi:DNA-binding MarR family transcriptional regulator
VEPSSTDKVTVSRVMASLFKRGWVNSRSNKLDGRSRLVNTSAEGQLVFVHLIPKMRAVENEILNCLDGEDISDLRRIMKKVVDGNG